jgi:hypothetical protein
LQESETRRCRRAILLPSLSGRKWTRPTPWLVASPSAWRIGRLQAEVARFRAICEDYDEARRALVYWLAAGQTGVTRAEEYRQIVAQLRAEASAALSAYESRRS